MENKPSDNARFGMRRLTQVVSSLVIMGTDHKASGQSPILFKRIRLVNVLSLACASVGLFSLPFDSVTAPAWMVAQDILTMCIYLCVPLLNKMGHHQYARLLFLILGNAIISVNTLLLGMEAGVFLCFFGLAAFALTLFDLHERALLVITLAIPIIEFFFFSWTGVVLGDTRLSPEAVSSYFIYSSIVAFFLLLTCIYFLQRANQDSEDELKSSRAQAIQAAKMAALGEMSSGLAHEINTPLAAIQLNSHLLKKILTSGKSNPKAVEEILDRIERMITRTAKVTHSLQTFSRSDQMDPVSEVSIKSIVDQTVELCSENFKNHGVDLKIGIIPEDFTLNCRSVQISQVLLNLLNNSYAAVKDLPERWVDLEVNRSNSMVQILVTDSGNGIPKSIQDRIFDPFFSTREPGKGTGIGLSISKGIIDSHGGELALDTDAPHTRFVISFPTDRPLTV